MARKAKASAKARPPSRRTNRLPLDDDPRWRLVEAVHKQLAERIGDPSVAAFDLTQALASGKVHCRRRGRHAIGWTRELTPSAFWDDWELRWWAEWDLRPELRHLSGLNVCPRQPSREKGAPYIPTLGVATFFVWQPDVDKLWPPLAANTQKPEPEIDQQPKTPPRRKPGPVPQYEWPMVVAREIIRRAKAQEKDPTVLKMIEFCAKELDYSPPLRAMQELFKKLGC